MKRLKKGFTLIELLVVIAIIGILATTLAPKLREQLAKAKDSKAIAVLGAVRTAANVTLTEKMVQDDTTDITLANITAKLDTSAETLLSNGDDIQVGGTRQEKDGTVTYNGEVKLMSGTAGVTSAAGISVASEEISLTLESTTADNYYSTENKKWNEY